MSALEIALFVIVLLLAVIGLGTWVFISMLVVAAVSLIVVLDFSFHRVGVITQQILTVSATKWELAAIPLFLFMGELVFRSDISNRIFNGVRPFIQWLPGSLIHTNILGSAIFAAVTGSSTATTATVGKITLPELKARGFDRKLAIGTLAASGSLGLLIPPSILLIIYGVLAEQSIIRLFTAGILPGLMICGIFMAYVVLIHLFRRAVSPRTEGAIGLFDYLDGVMQLLPIIILMVIVLGGIYSGFATPSEAAALGVFAAIVVLAVLRQLTFFMFSASLMGAVVNSCVITSIMIAASVLSAAVGFLHLPQNAANAIVSIVSDPVGVIVLLSLFYIVLGCFLDGISITVMTLPITVPLIMAVGYDPIWFGIYLVIMVEIGLLTPPLGLNLFVVRFLTGESIWTIVQSVAPFFVLMLLAAALLVAFPGIALWLPGVLY